MAAAVRDLLFILLLSISDALQGEPSTVDEVAALVKESWFWGTLDANAAQRALQAAKAGSYLIRFSGSVEGQFSVCHSLILRRLFFLKDF